MELWPIRAAGTILLFTGQKQGLKRRMMKKILEVKPLYMDSVLLIARVAIAVLMLVHGLPKLAMLFSGEPISFPGIMGMSPALSLFLAVFSEVVCSVLILFGLGTRLAVLPLIMTMLIAVFYFHMEDPFSSKELGLHYLLVYVLLFITGSGKYSADNLLLEKTRAFS
jgi:putative oxidoreductase